MDHSPHHHMHVHHVKSEINTDMTYKDGQVFIELKDHKGLSPDLSIQDEV